MNAVVIVDRAGGYRATKHLLDQGYLRIAHFSGSQHLNIYKHRRQSYEDALSEQNLPVEADLQIICNMKKEDGVSGMQQLLALPQWPDAIFSASDLTLIGALDELKEQGLRVPKDVGLMGFSNELFSRLTEP